MSHEPDWSLDFCLFCDKQTSEGPYCSQTCRLADLGKGLYTVQPGHSTGSSESSSPISAGPSQTNAYILPPAFDFQRASKSRSKSSPPLTLSESPRKNYRATHRRTRHHSFSSSSTSNPNATRSYSPSFTSSSPLAGNSPAMSAADRISPQFYVKLSEDARQQLQLYEESFENTRYQRVRSLS